jgi:hypothetical protein
MERNNRSYGDPWSLRQTGVYHKYSGFGAVKSRNLWILLHPMRKSRVTKRLEDSTPVEIGAADLSTYPLQLHLLVFSSYVDNWRHFLHDMTRTFLNLVRVPERLELIETKSADCGTGRQPHDERTSRSRRIHDLEFQHSSNSTAHGGKTNPYPCDLASVH